MGKTPKPPKPHPAPETVKDTASSSKPVDDVEKAISDHELLAEMLAANPEFASCW